MCSRRALRAQDSGSQPRAGLARLGVAPATAGRATVRPHAGGRGERGWPGSEFGGTGLGGSPGKPSPGRWESSFVPFGSRNVAVLHGTWIFSTSPSPHLREPLASVAPAVGGFTVFAGPFPGGGAQTPIFLFLWPFRSNSGGCGAREPPEPGPSLRSDRSGSMGGARHAGWVAAGLVLGAGACYCIYRLARGQRPGGQRLRLRSSRSAGEAVGNRAGGRALDLS